MRLVLQLVGPPRLMGAQQRFELRAGSLSIGRSPEADWTISDTDRMISRLHLRVDASHGDFVLTDTSANGVYMNGSTEPVGYGASVGLRNGDRLRIGEAEIAVMVEAGPVPSAGGETAPGANPFVLNAETFAEQIAAPASADPLGGPFGRAESRPQIVSPQAMSSQVASLQADEHSQAPPRMVVGADWMNEPVARAASPFRAQPDRGEAVVLPMRAAGAAPLETAEDRPILRRILTGAVGPDAGSVAALVEGRPELSAKRLAAILDAAGQSLEPQIWDELFRKIKSVMNNDAI